MPLLSYLQIADARHRYCFSAVTDGSSGMNFVSSSALPVYYDRADREDKAFC